MKEMMRKKTDRVGLVALSSLWLFSCAVSVNHGSQLAAGEDLSILTHGHYPQHVLLKLPRGFDAKKKYPLLVALHGNGGNAEGLSPAFNGFRDKQILIALPQGGYPKAIGGYSWFYETPDRSVWEAEDRNSVSRVVEAISEVASSYPVEKVYLFGFSQGVSLAYMIGLLHPSLVSGVAAVSGIMPEIDKEGSILHAADIEKAKNVRIFIARGTSDGLLERRHLTSQNEYFINKGFSVTLCEFQGGHTLTSELMGRVLEWLRALHELPAADDDQVLD